MKLLLYFCNIDQMKEQIEMKGIIYLIPNTLGDSPIDYNLPQENIIIINSIKHFIVEDIRTARRFLKKVNKEIDIDKLSFYVLDKHSKAEEIPTFLKPALDGFDMGIISEAGCPGVADPGADVVAIAHTKGLTARPLIGPSSILLSLMASGMNGQNFAFNGYLPATKGENIKALKHLEDRSIRERQTQIFIETPFRNVKLLQDMMFALRPSTRLCIAVDITTPSEMIVTKTVDQWRNKLPDLSKRPAIFLIQG